MPEVELRELRLFLALAEELHFGRTADRLGLTTSRVSQTLRALERKLGGRRLFSRTSRTVGLTEAGLELLAQLSPAISDLDRVLRAARARASGPGTVRVGLLNAASGVEVLTRAIARYEAQYPGSSVQLTTTPFEDRLGPLRRREVDLVVTRLPLNQPDIWVGPVLVVADQRVVMLGRTHPLADRADLSVEDLADHEVRRPLGVPPELAEATCNSHHTVGPAHPVRRRTVRRQRPAPLRPCARSTHPSHRRALRPALPTPRHGHHPAARPATVHLRVGRTRSGRVAGA